MISGVLQGLGLGLVFVPLSTLAFVTTKPEHRVDATSMFSLVRNVGSGVGISMVTSVLAQMSTINHAELAERITYSSPGAQLVPGLTTGNAQVMNMVNQLISQQGAMLAYLDDFQMMLIVTVVSAPIVFLLRSPKAKVKVDPAHAMAE